ncbi:probable splicing factor, arginine/serine-rich 5 [Crassostrea angulata]|uniref:probable splicing factor, arginine/serine-rich 5 n=1 Tax=Magallana angulata TaxID=2784310 RepID=UPI0022B1A444|nr:probable splicing factor, arginine/serine-rich 5 [Crassostrea angulata]
MSRRANEGSLFIGRLSKSTRVRDLEDIFEPYGRMTRCEIKYGAEMAYAFIDYEDHRDAEDAVRYENGREICGSSIIVERAKGAPRRSLASRGGSGYDDYRSGRGSRDYPDRYDRRSSGGPRGGRYRSPSPSRRRSRSRSRDRRRRSRSRSHSSRRRRRSSSISPRRSSKRSRSRSPSKSRSRSRSPQSKSRSRSPPRNGQLNDDKSLSRSPVDD